MRANLNLTKAIRLTRVSVDAYLGQPAGELVFLLRLGGPVNRPPSTGDHAGPPREVEVPVLMTPGQVAGLVVELLNGARRGGDPAVGAVLEALAAIGVTPPEAPHSQP